MLTRDFHFTLPPECVAQHPAAKRDESRLMVFHRGSGTLDHHRFRDVPDLLRAGDLLVLNDSRVIPARLRGFKEPSGGEVELLLLEENSALNWWAMLRPGKRVRPGSVLRLVTHSGVPSPVTGLVTEKNAEGWCRLQFTGIPELRSELQVLGEIPLPPYVERTASEDDPEDRVRYQTVYARHDGSVAAPTAGLHFTPAIFERLRAKGVEVRFVTLHVGAGTFTPVKTHRIADHGMHEERFEVPTETADAWNRARSEGRRVVAVGTTSVRVLESVLRTNAGRMIAGRGRTRIFLHPPDRFQAADVLLTNFHLPESTLLMLVSAFAAPGELEQGRLQILGAYREAIQSGYRFYSYGDAMLIA